jgi:NAD(P)-dependent dehydrogenase (short-subunit alcohol dehydrogenase family)
MEGRTGVVTGAASGIGRACALRLAAEGAKLVIADLESARSGAEETLRAIEQVGGQATFLAGDIRSAESNEALVATAVERYGRLDFAHNHVGLGYFNRLHEITDEEFDDTVATNLRGTFFGMRCQIREMLQSGGGAIVNTASTAALSAVVGFGAYAATKHGVVGLTKNAAAEYANDGIRVNAVCPGAILTPLMAGYPEEMRTEILAPQPMTRFGTPEEIAAAVTWLCSDESSFVTGVALPVDGGSVAWLSAHRS